MDKNQPLIKKQDIYVQESDPLIVHRHGSDTSHDDQFEYINLNRELIQFSLVKSNSINEKEYPLSKHVNRFLKRALDTFIAALVILLVLSWLIPLIALLIRSDSRGPVFFLQKRKKKDGKVFTCLKFRTMFVTDESDILPNCNETRITRFGRFLRKHYIDELPQFFNVLCGDMSVIGPRPHMVFENFKYEQLVQDYSLRHTVKPGITGLAQVLGYAGSTDLQKIRSRVFLDIYYMQHWSLGLDFRIMLRTLQKIAG